MKKLVLKEPFQNLWQGKDPFEEVEKISGRVVRDIDSRRTIHFKIDGKGFYLKLHHGTEFAEVIKNLFSFRMPVFGAGREWNAIHKLAENGIDTMTGVAYGESGENPLKKTSFIITEELESAGSLKLYWRRGMLSLPVQKILIERVASMVRQMHACGINHQDCYIGHFLIREPFDRLHGKEEDLLISIIDLHRAIVRNGDKVPLRWRNKDLVELLFSVRTLNFSTHNIYRFMKAYFQKPLRQIFKDEAFLIRYAKWKYSRMEQHHVKRIQARDGR